MAKDSPPAVPLICNICPKKPVFSDKSHLLTHISSKAHLSHKFKLEIRAQTELEARDQMTEYEKWYTDLKLEAALAERLASKESRKSYRRPRQSNVAGHSDTGEQLLKAENSGLAIKQEDTATETSLFGSPPRLPTSIMKSWANTPQQSGGTPDAPRNNMMDHLYETPTAQRTVPNFVAEDAVAYRTRSSSSRALRASSQQKNRRQANAAQDHVDPQDQSVMPPALSRPPKMEPFESLIDTSKLKGILWPGMDLFDSATGEMRRQRNQKKDDSVLQKMQENSTKVVADEWIFSADGNFDRKRNMYEVSPGNSPSQADMLPTPRPRKKRTTKKIPVLNLDDDADVQGIFDSPVRPKRRGRPSGKPKVTTAATPALPPLGTFQPAKFEPTAEEDSEFQEAVKHMIADKPFDVFRDISPGRTESPLESMKFDRSDSGLSNPNFNFPAFSNDGLSMNDYSTEGFGDSMMSNNDMSARHLTSRGIPLAPRSANVQPFSNIRQPFPLRLHGYTGLSGRVVGPMAGSHDLFSDRSYMADGFPPHVFQRSQRLMQPLHPMPPPMTLADLQFQDENTPVVGFGEDTKPEDSAFHISAPAIAPMTLDTDTDGNQDLSN